MLCIIESSLALCSCSVRETEFNNSINSGVNGNIATLLNATLDLQYIFGEILMSIVQE